MKPLIAQSTLLWSQVLFFAAGRMGGLSSRCDAKFYINKFFVLFFDPEIMFMLTRTTSLFSSNEGTGSVKYLRRSIGEKGVHIRSFAYW
jgi:hypothetical protein